jgi:hypothetical protein
MSRMRRARSLWFGSALLALGVLNSLTARGAIWPSATRRAERDQFSLGPVIMALLRNNGGRLLQVV